VSEQLLLTVDEAAARIGIKRSFAYELIREGHLRSVKIGGARRVATVDVLAFVERLRKEGYIPSIASPS
jgi:excisionase family DNA binding protein